ncbi:MAG TPA: DUF664 domain-containing protein [Nocardioidaceae bacterium]|nr:DUF664 domain-containing protein [Nocardioidaceae bacterium]
MSPLQPRDRATAFRRGGRGRRPASRPRRDGRRHPGLLGRARAAADQVIGELGMDDTGTAWFGDAVSLRWVLIHMVEETARHAGHIDILRELTDGMAGDHRGQ